MARKTLDWLKSLQRKLLLSAQPTLFSEHDVVKTKRELSPKVKKGTTGTVLLVYPGNQTHYEIEFTANSKTLEIFAVAESDLESVL